MRTILFSGPGKNALSTALMQKVLGEIRAAGDEPLFLTGEGDVFCAGLDLKEIVNQDEAGLTRYLGILEELVTALYEHPGPTVCWVNGHAIAGGCVMNLCCDVRVMTARESVRIGLNEVALGLKFPPRTFAMVKARLTTPQLSRVILESTLHHAKEAKELGLVDIVAEEVEARLLLEKLATYPRATYTYAKQVSRPPLGVTEEDERRFREDTIPHWISPDLKQKLRGVLARKA